MAIDEQHFFSVNDHLRFVLFGLECALNVEFNPAEVKRLFDNAEQDNSSGGEYVFWRGRGQSITGRVKPGESYYLTLRLESRRPVEPALSEIAERAKYHVYHIEQRIEDEITRRWELEQGGA